MNWEAVIKSLRAEASEAFKHAEALRKSMVATSGDSIMDERAKTIERHKINGNFCIALARALEAGLDT